MLKTPAGRGVLVGLIVGAVVGTLFGVFVISLDTETGRHIVIGITKGLKDHQDPVLDKFPEDRAKATGFVGLMLGLLTAWLIRRLLQHKTTTVPTNQPAEEWSRLVVGNLIETIVFGLVAAGCGLAGLEQADAGSPVLFVLLTAGGTAVLAGAYGLFVGWREGRRTKGTLAGS
jgi:hypothetical protein